MESKIKWVIRSRHGQFIGAGKLALTFEGARKYDVKSKAEADLITLKRNMRLTPFDETFFVEGWEQD